MHSTNGDVVLKIIERAMREGYKQLSRQSDMILDGFREYSHSINFRVDEVLFMARHCRSSQRSRLLIEAGIQYRGIYTQRDYELLMQVGGKDARPKLQRMKSQAA